MFTVNGLNLKNHTLFFAIFLLLGCASKAQPTKVTSVESAQPAVASLNAQAIGFPQFERPRVEAEFPAYLQLLKEYALQQGIRGEIINNAFSQVHFVSRAIQSDRGQLEKKITLDSYLQRVLPPAKITQARQKYQQYYGQLVTAGRRYGVDASTIAALWGIESNFGRLQGKEDVISAMATLAFEGRREAFFVKELLAALQILQNGSIAREQLKGSWAGAMGQCQFMPSSYLKYGISSSGKGHIDIWNNTADVFASMANYLATEGWQAGHQWGSEVHLPVDFNAELAGHKPEQAKTVAQWHQLGVKAKGNSSLPEAAARAWIILPDADQRRAFMVYDNFQTLMHWNRSYYFAISVGMLSDAL